MSNIEDSDWANLSYGSDSLEEEIIPKKETEIIKKSSPERSNNYFKIYKNK